MGKEGAAQNACARAVHEMTFNIAVGRWQIDMIRIIAVIVTSGVLYGCAGQEHPQVLSDATASGKEFQSPQSAVVYVRVAGVKYGPYPWTNGMTILDVPEMKSFGHWGRTIRLVHAKGTAVTYNARKMLIEGKFPRLEPGDMIDLPSGFRP